jgi:septum formation protein
MKHPEIILASNSPRRKELLREMLPQTDFTVIGSNIPEKPHRNEDGETFCLRMAEEKARFVATTRASQTSKDAIVIGADTIIWFNKEIIGQPRDTKDATRILEKLSGHCHEVITGVAVLCAMQEPATQFAVSTKVWFRNLDHQMIEEYTDSGEHIGKAGAYAIQSAGRDLIEKIKGSYTNVIGLPVDELKEVLQNLLE